VLPRRPLRVRSIREVTWAEAGRRVAVVVDTRADDGTEMTLRYELGLVRRHGRWLIRFIQTNPLSREDTP